MHKSYGLFMLLNPKFFSFSHLSEFLRLLSVLEIMTQLFDHALAQVPGLCEAQADGPHHFLWDGRQVRLHLLCAVFCCWLSYYGYPDGERKIWYINSKKSNYVKHPHIRSFLQFSQTALLMAIQKKYNFFFEIFIFFWMFILYIYIDTLPFKCFGSVKCFFFFFY